MAEGSSSRLRSWSCCTDLLKHHATVSESACKTADDGSRRSTVSGTACNTLDDDSRRFGTILPSPSVIICTAYIQREKTTEPPRSASKVAFSATSWPPSSQASKVSDKSFGGSPRN